MDVETSQTAECVSQSNNLPLPDRVAQPLHFVGIGGIGMSALAKILLERGFAVSGSDKSENPITEELCRLGAKIYIGHNASNLGQAKSLVVSTAISPENPELKEAQKLGLNIYHRAELLAYLARNSKLVAISGTHGKTTTSGMLAQVFIDCGLDPTVVVGGIFAKISSNARCGSSPYFVAEADESDRTHKDMDSEIAVITNIEPDHLENYPGGFPQILKTMQSFGNRTAKAVVLCLDDAGCRQLKPQLDKTVISYGSKELSPEADYTIESHDDGSFSFYHKKDKLGRLKLSVPGKHNQLNAAAAIAVALLEGLSFEHISKSLAEFKGVARRFQILGQGKNITVVDDYGHHPTEVAATLCAAKEFMKSESGKYKRLVAIFQPHQPGRLRDLWSDFCQAFGKADLVLIADIYIARGQSIEGISSERFCKEIEHENCHYIAGPTSSLPEKILPFLKNGDLVLTIGAGDITNVGTPVLKLLNNLEK